MLPLKLKGWISLDCEHHIPTVYVDDPTVGLISPVTGASGLVIYLAGALSGLTIIQLKQRGTSAVIGCVPNAMDLRTARPSYGSPEMSLYTGLYIIIPAILGFIFLKEEPTPTRILGIILAVSAILLLSKQ